MTFHVRAGIEQWVLELLKAAANQERRSLANMAGKILTDHFEARRALAVDRLEEVASS
ncbi:hypothetical protein T8K17_13765 [Thalassobaculum sp. OXR-137]|uniref:hypothetical protein n=1 Tax=Thalassobaculum sp. OXR-137 TaxID=3100173 RepID=UPI002AC90A3C|nr:hypothetical protein [Thalassobaculum sp. OXR-137]WPZ32307.1 hypothetical protein T8K17_13765 [Thalassobaculum sp. OXR-137]